MDNTFVIRPIGIVRSPVLSRVDENWGKIEAEIHLQSTWAAALTGLSEFSHAIILTWLHQASFDYNRDLVRRPRGQAKWPEVGIFAQRAKNRPNPIGLSVVDILSCNENILKVRQLDAIDGTPVIDIKPYYTAFDRIETVVEPAWVHEVMADYF
ncbi:MAG: tRNA (N6-threonylcarbamoyladenosine(37)-N6)-methyltransferase TrmO [Betaproteobacteria bacterium]|nr:tRNA (N6-threonylcarbamoyladenosine(37)-N6)-methyltransferase TrmO [Betaproteobacteria bacterium]